MPNEAIIANLKTLRLYGLAAAVTLLSIIIGVSLAGIFLSAPAEAESGAARDRGLELSIEFCSRCHVIGDYNRMGGIGNSPSFNYMAQNDDYVERFTTFYARRPHPVFARVPGYPKWSDSDSYYPEFEITQEQIEDIVAYVATLATAR